MATRIGDEAPDFTAQTTEGTISEGVRPARRGRSSGRGGAVVSRPARSWGKSRTFLARLGSAVQRIPPAGPRASADRPTGVSLASARVRVMATPLRLPVSPTEREAFQVVRHQGAVPLDALAREVARHLYAAEIQRGTWVATVEHFGPHTYLPGVARVIQEVHGVLWHLDPVTDAGAAEPRTTQPPRLEGARS